MRSFWKKIFAAASLLHTADRCLLVFMLLLLTQSAYNLFVFERTMQEGSAFNIIIRTTAAAIFGYFVSANFQHEQTRVDAVAVDAVTVDTPSAPANSQPSAKIGFTSSPAPLLQKRVRCSSETHPCLQLLIVGVIGISSLLMMIIAHNFFPASEQAVATFSQLRDFVSGSVGFLIGQRKK